MTWLRLVPGWAWWILALLAVALGAHTLGATSGYLAGAKSVQAQWDKERAETLERALKGAQEARRFEQRALSMREEIDREQAQRANERDRINRALNSELDRLRSALAAAGSYRTPEDPATAGVLDGTAATTGQLLAACAGRHSEVARDADRLADQVRGLQQYAERVCQAKQPTTADESRP